MDKQELILQAEQFAHVYERQEAIKQAENLQQNYDLLQSCYKEARAKLDLIFQKEVIDTLDIYSGDMIVSDLSKAIWQSVVFTMEWKESLIFLRVTDGKIVYLAGSSDDLRHHDKCVKLELRQLDPSAATVDLITNIELLWRQLQISSGFLV